MILAVALAVAGLLAAQTRPAHAAELVTNYHFGSGTTGWQTKGPDQTLRSIAIPGGNAVRLTTSTTRTAVLDDARITVANAGSPGARYAVKARVRSNTGVTGSLRFNEVATGGSTAHQSAFTTEGGDSWQMVYLQVTTSRTDPAMDVNVVANSLRPGQTLDVDLVSVEQTASTVAKDRCQGALPGSTQFGASLSTSSLTHEQSLAQVDAAFGKVPVVRIFDPGLPFAWDHRRNDDLAGRNMVLSFRPMPQEILSGKHDAFFKKWFAEAPTDRKIFWSYIHEPEPLINSGKFTATQYRAAWDRLDRFADDACRPNMFSTLILTGWTADPASKRDYRTYDAGKDVVDVLAWDPYNGASDPNRDFYSPVSDFMAPAVKTSIADGRPWGIAETGSRLVPGDNGTGRAAWLNSLGKYAIANDATFVTYFQSTNDGNWRLDDKYSRAAWAAFVAR